jgi:hypothetical protein
MRKTIITLAAVVGTMAAFGGAAGPAAADDPNARHHYGDPMYTAPGSTQRVCDTPYKPGISGQYGAWGYFVDGCTTVSVPCSGQVFAGYSGSTPIYTQPRYCSGVSSKGKIDTYFARGERVTLNARLRVFNSSGQVIWYRDKSCEGVDTCSVSDLYPSILYPGQSTSLQCNGVRQGPPLSVLLAGGRDSNTARVSCSAKLTRYA